MIAPTMTANAALLVLVALFSVDSRAQAPQASGSASMAVAASAVASAASPAKPKPSPVTLKVLGNGQAIDGAEVLIKVGASDEKKLFTNQDGAVSWTPPGVGITANIRVIAKGWATYRDDRLINLAMIEIRLKRP